MAQKGLPGVLQMLPQQATGDSILLLSQRLAARSSYFAASYFANSVKHNYSAKAASILIPLTDKVLAI